MIRRQPRSTRTDTLFPYTTLFRSAAGTVRLAAPDTLTTHILLPSLRPLLDRYPALKLELVTGIATVGIARGEADLALRLVRPEQGALTVRQVGRMAHSL